MTANAAVEDCDSIAVTSNKETFMQCNKTTTLLSIVTVSFAASSSILGQCAAPTLDAAVLPEVRASAAVARDNFGGMFVAGGNLDGPQFPNPIATASVRRYREVGGQLVETTNVAPVMPPMLQARSEHGIATDRYGRVYVFGGWTNGEADPLASCERFDPRSNLWASIAPLPSGRGYCRAVASLDGMSIFVVGGQSATSSATSSVFRFDVASGSWSTESPMVFPRTVHGAAMGKDGRIFAVAGTGPSGAAKLEARNPSTGQWSELPSAPTFVEQAAACYADGLGRIHLMGAYQNGGWLTETNHQVFDPALGTWAACASFMPPTNNMAAVQADSGRIYLFGGQSFLTRLNTIRRVDSQSVCLTTTQYGGSGAVDVRVTNGTPGHLAITVISLNPANNSVAGLGGLGTGWWGGLHASLQDVSNTLGAGTAPLWMLLDASGGSSWSLPAGSLSFLTGLTFFSSTQMFDPTAWGWTGFSYPTAITLR